MDVIHDDAASYFTEGMNHRIVSNAGGREDTGVWSDFAAITDDGGSNDVAACVDFCVFSYGDGAFDGDSFFYGATGVFAGDLDHCFVDGDEVPGVDNIHP